MGAVTCRSCGGGWRTTGRTVAHRNLSLPGAVFSRAVEDLARDIGRPITDLAGNFIERQAPFVPTNTTHVTIFAGGNDANVIGRAALAGRGGNDVSGYIDAQVRQWGTDLDDLIARIRSPRPNARIVVLNLINLAGAPYVASRPTSEKSIMQRIAVGLSDRVNALTSRNVLVVDSDVRRPALQPSNYASDGFHPGDGGYAIFAEMRCRRCETARTTCPTPAAPSGARPIHPQNRCCAQFTNRPAKAGSLSGCVIGHLPCSVSKIVHFCTLSQYSLQFLQTYQAFYGSNLANDI